MTFIDGTYCQVLKSTINIKVLQELEKGVPSKIEGLSREVGKSLTYKGERSLLAIPRGLIRGTTRDMTGVAILLQLLSTGTTTALTIIGSHPVFISL